LCAFVDHGPAGTGEPLAMLLRPGNAGANTAADHKTVLADALAQLPYVNGYRVGRTVLIRTDAGGGTHEFLDHLTARRLACSVGFGLTETMVARLALIPAAAWTPAYDSDGGVREGAWVVEATGVCDTPGWPPGMRVIVRKERPHPGAQLRFTDHDGLRLTAFVTNTRRGQRCPAEPDDDPVTEDIVDTAQRARIVRVEHVGVERRLQLAHCQPVRRMEQDKSASA
jgi:hypothetical protein